MRSRRASTGYRRHPAAPAAGRRGNRRAFTRLRGGSQGQGTLEYALVLFAFLGVLAGLGAIGHVLGEGDLVRHALQSASHHLSSAAPGAFADVFMY